jgi:hypothetical protein
MARLGRDDLVMMNEKLAEPQLSHCLPTSHAPWSH